MKIQEVEKILGMSQQNLRFYEEQGLISPKRLDNGYRNYDESDVQRLKEIKLLRSVGISIEKIRLFQKGDVELDELIGEQLLKLGQEEEKIKRIRRVCEGVLQSNKPLLKVDEYLNQFNEVNGMQEWKKQDIKQGLVYMVLGLIWPDLLNAQLAEDLSEKN